MATKWRPILALLLIVGLVATSCGSSGNADTVTDAATDAADAATDAVAGDSAGAPAEALKSIQDECSESTIPDITDDFNIVLVTDIGKVDDGTFNQYAYEGMTGAASCLGAQTSYIETASEADYAANIATALESDPEVVITVGFLLATDTMETAQANPDVLFVGIDQWQPEFPDNYIGVLFNEHEGGYIAGTLAAAMSETGIVGIVAGREDVPPVVKFVNGFRAGAEAHDSGVEVLSVYNESFGDPAKGASDARSFIGEGADVIMGAGGPTGSGGVKAAAADGAFAIGVDQDEYYTTFGGGSIPGSENLISSAMKRVDLGVFRTVLQAADGSFAGGIYTLTAENLGITYAPFHDAPVTADASAAVEAARAGLASGAIDTGVCGIDGLYVGQGSACD